MDNLYAYVFIVGAAQGFLLMIFLLRKKENKIANLLLSITMFFFSFDLILESAAVTGYIRNYPKLAVLMQTLPFLYGPAVYLYVIFTIRGIKNYESRYIYHIIPFILVQIYALVFLYFEPSSYQLNWVYRSSPLPLHLLVVSYLTPIYGGLYITFTAYEAYRYNQELKNEFSSINRYNLSWIKFFSIGAISLWITAATMSLLQIFIFEKLKPELISYLAISIFLYAMAFKALRQPEISSSYKEETETKKKNKTESYKKSGLSDEDANNYLKKLLKLMDEEKPYKSEKLSLSLLSNQLQISNHNLSEVINTKIEQSFYDFINEFRVEEVKRLIMEDKESKYSILALGFEAGFSSKSAFYSAFKKFTGMTPSQYRKQNIESISL